MFETLYYMLGYPTENEDSKKVLMDELKSQLIPNNNDIVCMEDIVADSDLVVAPARNVPTGVGINDIKDFMVQSQIIESTVVTEKMVLDKLSTLKPVKEVAPTFNDLRIVIKRIGSKWGGGYQEYFDNLRINKHRRQINKINNFTNGYEDYFEKLKEKKLSNKSDSN